MTMTKTASDYVAAQLDWAQECFNLTVHPDPKHGPGTPRYDKGVVGTICGWQQAVLMEVIRKLNPEVADRLAFEIEESLDDGGIVAELLYEWRNDLAVGVPISAPRTYRTIFDTALGPWGDGTPDHGDHPDATYESADAE